jgi:hypothetical protein
LFIVLLPLAGVELNSGLDVPYQRDVVEGNTIYCGDISMCEFVRALDPLDAGAWKFPRVQARLRQLIAEPKLAIIRFRSLGLRPILALNCDVIG